MIKGYAINRIDRLAWEIALVDENRNHCYTFEFKCHDLSPLKRHESIPTSLVSKMAGEADDIFRGLAEAMNQMGFLNDTATTAELKATKYHLEDMRKLALPERKPSE